MGDAAKQWNKAVEDPSALMDLRARIENVAPVRAQSELTADNEQLKMDAAFAANAYGMADKDRAVAMAASNLLRAKLEKWESIFSESDPKKVREYHQDLVAMKNAATRAARRANQQLRDLWRDVDAVRSDELTNRIAELETERDELAKTDITRRDRMTRLEYDLRSERLVTSELTKRIAELEQEVERLRAAMASQNDEITQVLGKALGYTWYRDDPANFPAATEADGVCVGEHVAETIASEAASRIAMLQAELAKAPRWVPVDDCVESEMECTYHLVHGTIQGCSGEEPFIYREAYYEQGAWIAGGTPICVTHVLANLNPPDVATNEGPNRLREMASREDNGCGSVGGLVGRVKADEAQGATEPPRYACQTCSDTGCAVDPRKPMVESSADCLVPCRRCNGKQLMECPACSNPEGEPQMDALEKRQEDVRGYRGVDSMTALGNKTNEQCRQSTPRDAVIPDALGIRDVVKAACDRGKEQPQCLDMLGQDVVSSDVLWDTKCKILEKRPVLDAGDYEQCVRCPRPGEAPRNFDGWQAMCIAMQKSGAKFQMSHSRRDKDLSFIYPVARYVRSPDCTWKGPK
jgi:uncharacterized small protein (DUF1192 family)